MSSSLLNHLQMKLKIDHREQDLIASCKNFLLGRESYQGIELEISNLPIGDVILCDANGVEKVIIERKSIADLAASIKDGRYEEQSYRLNGLSHANHNIMYIIEGDLNKVSSFKSRIDKSVLYSAIFSLNYYKGFSVLRTNNLDETASLVCHMIYKLKKGLSENKRPYYQDLTSVSEEQNLSQEQSLSQEQEEKEYCNVVKRVKKENITSNNIGEIMLCQIPGVSSTTAMEIMKQFNSLPALVLSLKENPDCMKGISYTNAKGQTGKINKTAIETIKLFLHL
jgi:ERCC4-type nuclease